MRVLDHEPGLWFLVEDGDDLLVDGNYSNSFFGYAYPIRLAPEEAKAYRREGRGAIHALVAQIQHSVPVSPRSSSPFLGRRLDADTTSRMHKAIRAWKGAL